MYQLGHRVKGTLAVILIIDPKLQKIKSAPPHSLTLIYSVLLVKYTIKCHIMHIFAPLKSHILMKIDNALEKHLEDMGDDHVSAAEDTPLRKDAFVLSDEEKITRIRENVNEIMLTLGLDLEDDSLKGTPNRVAKMFVTEIFGGLDPKRKPNPSTFDNKYKYGEMLVEKNITLYSTCEHHLLPIVGKAHIAYISNGSVIGLSKMNRIVDYYAKRPQVQERLNIQVVRELQRALGTEDVACVMDAKHLCVNSRGIRDIESSTITAEYGGRFQEEAVRSEFLSYINIETKF